MNGQNGAWTWRELLTSIEEDARRPSRNKRPTPRRPRRRNAARRRPIRWSVWRRRCSELPRHAPHHGGQAVPAADMIEHMGVRLSEVFSASALDRIARQRARSGTQSRRRGEGRRPDAVRRLGEHLMLDQNANHEAMMFLRAAKAAASPSCCHAVARR